jgi:tetratricopeptide (TPR) repeat protein
MEIKNNELHNEDFSTFAISGVSAIENYPWSKSLIKNLCQQIRTIYLPKTSSKLEKDQITNTLEKHLGISTISTNFIQEEDISDISGTFHFGELKKNTFPENYNGKRIITLHYDNPDLESQIELARSFKTNYLLCDFWPDEIDSFKDSENLEFLLERFIFFPPICDEVYNINVTENGHILIKSESTKYPSNNTSIFPSAIVVEVISGLQKIDTHTIDTNDLEKLCNIILTGKFSTVYSALEDPRANHFISLLCESIGIKVCFMNNQWPSILRHASMGHVSPWIEREKQIRKSSIRSTVYSYLGMNEKFSDKGTSLPEINQGVTNKGFILNLLNLVSEGKESSNIIHPYLTTSILFQMNSANERLKRVMRFEGNKRSQSNSSFQYNNMQKKLVTFIFYAQNIKSPNNATIESADLVAQLALSHFFLDQNLSQKEYTQYACTLNEYPFCIKACSSPYINKSVTRDTDLSPQIIKNFLLTTHYVLTNFTIENKTEYLEHLLQVIDKIPEYINIKKSIELYTLKGHLLINLERFKEAELWIDKLKYKDEDLSAFYAHGINQFLTQNFVKLSCKEKLINYEHLIELLEFDSKSHRSIDTIAWAKSRCMLFNNQHEDAYENFERNTGSAPRIYYTLLAFESCVFEKNEIGLKYLKLMSNKIENTQSSFDLFRSALFLVCGDEGSFSRLLKDKNSCAKHWLSRPDNYWSIFSHCILKKAAAIDQFSEEITSKVFAQRTLCEPALKLLDQIQFGSYSFSDDLNDLFTNHH